MAEIKLTKGMVAHDDDMFEYLSQWKWAAQKGRNTYYARTIPRKGEKGVRMHRLVAGVSDPSVFVDHKNRDGLKNTRDNLRLCTRETNGFNRASNIGSVSRFKGVSPIDGGFNVEIRANRVRHYLGFFYDEIEAARHYNARAVELHGEYAVLNDVEPLFPTAPAPVLRRSNTSGYRGVSWHKNIKKWCATITVNYRQTALGYFDDPIEAARARDAKALELFGPKAKLNFPKAA